ncbi:MAG: DUF4038 domain-containing protein [Verrucomicrobia bacterium]|nr:DUF4038 domain-containing protein [Verrucomicrobiota bacterium]
MKPPFWLTPLALASLLAAMLSAAPAPDLKLGDDRRQLVTADGKPFLWLGDTAWELFHRTTRAEADRYLEHRAQHGYTVIHAVALAELNGLADPTPAGHRPLIANDPTRPDVKDGPDNDYWDHVDYIVRKANALGLIIGFLPSWGDKWTKKWGEGPEIFTPENAETYGQWLGRRYRDAKIVWILGGDRPVENDQHRAIIRRMAAGLRAGDGGAHLCTFHPSGGHGSAEYFHADAWLDFNMRQNGHGAEFTGRYDQTAADYAREPVKPVVEGEPVYEDHPLSFKAKELGHSLAADVRRPLYWNLFTGACGVSYGHHSVWQMWLPGRKPVNNPLLPWPEALDRPGALQMKHGRALVESRPMQRRVPDQEIIVPDAVPTALPGAGTRRFVAMRDADGTYAMVYAPVGRAFRVRMTKISADRARTWWFNPRDGTAREIGVFPCQGERTFTPPDDGELTDWVLVLDAVAKNYPAPGRRR